MSTLCKALATTLALSARGVMMMMMMMMMMSDTMSQVVFLLMLILALSVLLQGSVSVAGRDRMSSLSSCTTVSRLALVTALVLVIPTSLAFWPFTKSKTPTTSSSAHSPSPISTDGELLMPWRKKPDPKSKYHEVSTTRSHHDHQHIITLGSLSSSSSSSLLDYHRRHHHRT